VPFGGVNHRTIATEPSTCAGCAVIPTSAHRRLTLRTCRSTCCSNRRPSFIQSHRLNESLVNMRNVRTSLIVGVLIVELVFGAFLLSQKSHRSTVDTDVTTNSSAQWAATSPQLGDTHVAVYERDRGGAIRLASSSRRASAATGHATTRTGRRPCLRRAEDEPTVANRKQA
jgi:hypothetical protein